jgi:hypothetical protein
MRWTGHAACMTDEKLIQNFNLEGKRPLGKHRHSWILTGYFLNLKSWGSSVSVVSDYRLDDQCLIPDRGRGFFL